MNEQALAKRFVINPLKAWKMCNSTWLENFYLKEIKLLEIRSRIKEPTDLQYGYYIFLILNESKQSQDCKVKAIGSDTILL